MTELKGIYWQKCLSQVSYAFQPIVNIHSGVCFGVEALLRNVSAAGFDSIAGLFDQAHGDRVLPLVHRLLCRRAIDAFRCIPWHERLTLFYNLDNRLFNSEQYTVEAVVDALDAEGLADDRLCFEISEQHDIDRPPALTERLDVLRKRGVRIAVDDFGVGFSGLRLLYYSRPDYIKIDRFFIEDISHDPEKRMLAGCIVSMAHQMGGTVIAEGVESEAEYHECRRLGCDLVQGFLIQKPQLDPGRLKNNYPIVLRLCEKERRHGREKDVSLVEAEIEYVRAIASHAPVTDILDAFKNEPSRTFFPVVNPTHEPVGIIREASLKGFIYSRFGRFVLENQSFNKRLDELITRIPQVDVRMPIEHILEVFSGNDGIEGLLVTNSGNYIGFLSAPSMLRILNEKKLALARDQNPLSNLPGNNSIFEFVSRALRDIEQVYVLVYFDFDNFKAYNDTYGFRQGDRVILLFSELLKAHTLACDCFVGHIGGDDFFMGTRGIALADVMASVQTIAGKFKANVESFYEKAAVKQGCIRARGRDGHMQRFPLMTVSCAILELPEKIHRIYSAEEIGTLIAGMKKQAKQSPDNLSAASLTHFRPYRHETGGIIRLQAGQRTS